MTQGAASAMRPAEAELKTDKSYAEALLMELTADLRYVPVEETTRVLHTRALQLKRLVSAWSASTPDEAARQATCREILALQYEAREFRARLPSGAQLARAH